MQAQRGVEGGGDAGDGADRVRHQRAAAGAGFGQDHLVRPAQGFPGDGGPGAQDLAKGLADLEVRW